jgi:hypothetical protein
MKDRDNFTTALGYYKSIYRELLNGSEDYQLLCAYCDWLKRENEKQFIQSK